MVVANLAIGSSLMFHLICYYSSLVFLVVASLAIGSSSMSHLIHCFCLVFVVVATLATSSRFMLHVRSRIIIISSSSSSLGFMKMESHLQKAFLLLLITK